ncbi:TetR/AcrR family transcriptional regulator [Arthrobacter sp. 08Y14]|uniref:TetR/AcrR family transcriptional regulator n=1 Tax=Arthrobacter sp. 08Y14 TaxID=2058885 RepID=UPI000CE4D0E7|nr:TetR/AcrR family transcriptional regulator [Arthrobacter sp. 08Y14]
MSRELPVHHQQVAAAKRLQILNAAKALFLKLGYDRTSLARVAEDAGVSKATLFKQFPTKAALFEATVLAAGDTSDAELVDPPAGDIHAGLLVLGLAYAEVLSRPGMADLIRAVIAESPRFPELRQRTFNFGTLPVLAALDRFFRSVNAAGTGSVNDPVTAASQFLGMIASEIFWPRLVHSEPPPDAERTRQVVDQAALTIAARYGNARHPQTP